MHSSMVYSTRMLHYIQPQMEIINMIQGTADDLRDETKKMMIKLVFSREFVGDHIKFSVEPWFGI